MATAILLIVLVGSLLAAAALLAVHLQRVYEGRPAVGAREAPWLGPVERSIYRALRIDPEHDMAWGQYARAVLVVLARLGALPLRAPAPAGRRCR